MSSDAKSRAMMVSAIFIISTTQLLFGEQSNENSLAKVSFHKELTKSLESGFISSVVCTLIDVVSFIHSSVPVFANTFLSTSSCFSELLTLIITSSSISFTVFMVGSASESFE